MEPVQVSWPRRALSVFVVFSVGWGAWELAFSKMHFVDDACLWYDTNTMVALGSERRYVNSSIPMFRVPYKAEHTPEVNSLGDSLEVSFRNKPGEREKLIGGIDQSRYAGCRQKETAFGLTEYNHDTDDNCGLTPDYIYYYPIVQDTVDGAVRISCSKDDTIPRCRMKDYFDAGWLASISFPREHLAEWKFIRNSAQKFFSDNISECGVW